MVTGATASSRLRARPKALVSTRDDDRVGVRHRGDGVAGAAQVSDAPRSAHDQGHPRAGGDTELGPDTLADARVGRYGRDWRPNWRVGRARLADYQVCVEILLHPGGVGVKVGHKRRARPRQPGAAAQPGQRHRHDRVGRHHHVGICPNDAFDQPSGREPCEERACRADQGRDLVSR